MTNPEAFPSERAVDIDTEGITENYLRKRGIAIDSDGRAVLDDSPVIAWRRKRWMYDQNGIFSVGSDVDDGPGAEMSEK